ncbi:MAG: hypothetical protein ABIU54_02510 [Candidatus Eisenbacteria bacterium]
MKSLATRVLAVVVMAVVSVLLLMGATAKPGTQEPNKLIILSTTDVKGKTSPCG